MKPVRSSAPLEILTDLHAVADGVWWPALTRFSEAEIAMGDARRVPPVRWKTSRGPRSVSVFEHVKAAEDIGTWSAPPRARSALMGGPTAKCPRGRSLLVRKLPPVIRQRRHPIVRSQARPKLRQLAADDSECDRDALGWLDSLYTAGQLGSI